MSTPDAPRPQIINMLSPEDEKTFSDSLPDNTGSVPELELTPPEVERPINPETGKPRRSTFGRKMGPRKPKSETSQISDPQLERAKRKFSSLGGGRAVKKFFDLIDKPLETDEVEDVDDYFYLLSKKANLDPSESWLMMLFCFIILLSALASARLSWADDLKHFFSPDNKQQPDEQPVELNTE